VLFWRLAWLALVALVSGCGFHLRGAPLEGLSHVGVFVESRQGEQDELLFELRNILRSSAELKAASGNADWSLRVMNQTLGKKILAVEPGGKRQQLQLTYSVSYELQRGIESAPIAQDITVVRDFLFDPALILAMNTEESALKREMTIDAAHGMVVQLSLLHRRNTHAN
jgi:LPS-assembly lipoprotein